MYYTDSVEQVWIFGSSARNDKSAISDTDILIVSDEENIDFLIPDLKKEFGNNLDVAHYSNKGMNKIISKSSLFAVHLRNEGMPIYEKSQAMRDSLMLMADYSAHLEDLKVLGELLDDVSSSLDQTTESLIFEHGVLGTVTRNVGIILTHYLGMPDFSTNAALTLGEHCKELKVPISQDEYSLLQLCRKSGERGCMVDGTTLDINKFFNHCRLVREWYLKCVAYVCEKGNL